MKMPRLATAALIWGLCLALLRVAPANAADFEKGLKAANSGDFATALAEWQPLAEQGDASAQFYLGQMYLLGKGVPQDNQAALKWYTLAAEQGDAAAQFILGGMYNEGLGVPQDDKTAVKWYTLSAEQGDATAQNNLGTMYFQGNGVPQDYTESVKWYRLAAEQGDASAQFNLGEKYRQGKGVPQDNVLAYMWLLIVAVGELEKTEEAYDLLNYLESNMSESDISSAIQLAGTCVEQNFKGCQR